MSRRLARLRTPPPLCVDGLLVAAVLAAFAPAMAAGFIWDDNVQVVENEALRSLSGLRAIWTDPGSQMQYYPLTYTSYWLEHALWGTSARGYHVVNVLLHALNAVLLRRLLVRMAIPGAVLAAAVWALHPIQVESVAWVAERRNVLSTALVLATFHAWLRYADGRQSRDYLAVLASFTAAALAKTAAITTPALLAVWIVWRGGASRRRLFAATLPIFAIGAALAGVTVEREHAYFARGAPSAGPLMAESWLVAGRAFWFYLAKLAWPCDLQALYPRWLLRPGDLVQWAYPAAAAGMGLALLAARRRLGGGPLAAYAFYVIALAPVLGFVGFAFQGFSFVADRFVYVASLAPVTLAAATLVTSSKRLPERLGSAAIAIATGVSIGLGVASHRLARIYESEEGYWSYNLGVRQSATAYSALGEVHRERGEFEQAEDLQRESIALRDTARARMRLGLIHAARAEPSRALAELHRALALTQAPGQLRSLEAQALYNIGVVHWQRGDGDRQQALDYWQRALEVDPNMMRARKSLAVAHRRAGSAGSPRATRQPERRRGGSR